MWPCRIAVGVLAILVATAPVHAVEDPDTEIAKRHFATGAELYEQGKYAEAIVEFSAARDVRPAPAFDFNIARCYDRLERARDAIKWYERYLATDPPAENDGGARARLATLRIRVAKEREIPRYSVAAPAAVGAAAIAFWVAGGVLYGVSGSQYDHYESIGCGTTMKCGPSVTGGTEKMERAGIGLMITGGVLTAADLVLWAARRRR